MTETNDYRKFDRKKKSSNRSRKVEKGEGGIIRPTSGFKISILVKGSLEAAEYTILTWETSIPSDSGRVRKGSRGKRTTGVRGGRRGQTSQDG